MCYLLYIGAYNSISARLYAIYEEEWAAEDMGRRLKEGGGCDYYYVQKEVIIRGTVY